MKVVILESQPFHDLEGEALSMENLYYPLLIEVVHPASRHDPNRGWLIARKVWIDPEYATSRTAEQVMG